MDVRRVCKALGADVPEDEEVLACLSVSNGVTAIVLPTSLILHARGFSSEIALDTVQEISRLSDGRVVIRTRSGKVELAGGAGGAVSR